MLKLVTTPREPSRRPPKRGKVNQRLHGLDRKVAQGEEAGNAIQRAVAAGRRGIIDAHGRLQRTASESRCRNPPIPATAAGSEAEIVRRLTGIHQRLLFFSASVELEMDRLAMVREDIERLGGGTGREPTS
jgi:hypothetical protein